MVTLYVVAKNVRLRIILQFLYILRISF